MITSDNKVFANAQEFIDHLEQEWAESPWHEKARVFVGRKRRRLAELRRSPRWAWQRARRGYSDQDTWSFDHHLATIIVGAVTQLLDRRLGHPARITGEEWDMTLTKIISGFRLYLDMDYTERTKKQHKQVEEAKQLLIQHFEDLWD